ncbi:hypothetical protein DPSP01_010825 [Paraphaeosphaeria sporulosa]|uniref:Uncharacterized protein n=1 Tax=Paraphaeosphaeria sporulosa TaxID=1460663 RepID=A0A177C2F1_9PLEO|nr:uncharacterized protein CC84DRAFT_1228343 [Paraphaeosphaeria sporulosa]OAG01331.1 hypothetical protein CC84DRAFT_1228343 [Paraphaeosphaeria sporulosa]
MYRPGDIVLMLQTCALVYQKYQIQGASSGGPFTLAVAAIAPKREVLATRIIAGAVPIEAGRRCRNFRRLLGKYLLLAFPWCSKLQARSQLQPEVRNIRSGQIAIFDEENETTGSVECYRALNSY